MKLTVIVVGAGVIACTLADELTRQGASVTVIDTAEMASGTSSATFAWVNANDKSPEDYSYLNFLGIQAHERAAARGGRWVHQTGMIQIAQTRGGSHHPRTRRRPHHLGRARLGLHSRRSARARPR